MPAHVRISVQSLSVVFRHVRFVERFREQYEKTRTAVERAWRLPVRKPDTPTDNPDVESFGGEFSDCPEKPSHSSVSILNARDNGVSGASIWRFTVIFQSFARKTGRAVLTLSEEATLRKPARGIDSFAALLIALLFWSMAVPSFAQAPLVNGGFVVGFLQSDDDVETYQWSASAGDKVHIRVATTAGSTIRPRLDLLDPNGMTVGVNSGNTATGIICDGTFNCSIELTGVYTVQVSNTSIEQTGGYRLYFTSVQGLGSVPDLNNGGFVAWASN